MKRIVGGLLTAVWLLAACCSASALDSPPMYALGMDELIAIPEVVGERKCTARAWSDIDLEYTYESATVQDDLLAYIGYLGEAGFAVTRGASLSEPGEGELVALSKDAGFLLRVRLFWTLSDYRIQFAKYERTPATTRARKETDAEKQGRVALKEELYVVALRIFDTALAEHPDIAAYHALRGEALVGLGRYTEAIKSLNIALQLDPDFWEPYCELGVAYFNLEQWDQALEYFQKAVDMNPDDPVAFINLAYAQNTMGALAQSVLTCIFGLSLFPENDELWRLLGDAQYSIGRDEAALYAYDKAISFGNYTAGSFPSYDAVKESAG